MQLIQQIKDICEQNEIPFIDCSNAEEFQDAAYFCDHSYLNAQGARLFSQYIAKNKIIKGLLANGLVRGLKICNKYYIYSPVRITLNKYIYNIGICDYSLSH